jgi:hypothetical protein
MTAPTVFGSPQTPTPPASWKLALQTCWVWTHKSMALLGLVLATAVVLFVTQPGLRSSAEQHVFGWLLDRQFPDTGWALDPQALENVTATDPVVLPQDQARLADWLSRKYRVAKEPISVLVAEAFAVGQQTRVDPMLILSVMAMESRFNPFAASPVGAQGLMQVMTRVHSDKFESFGGDLAAFDPVSNLRVGALVLKETIRRAGSVEGGLRLYVGAVTSDGSDYINKVLSEHDRLKRVAEGQRVAFNAFQRQTPAIEADPPVLPDDIELEAEVRPPQIEPLSQAS